MKHLHLQPKRSNKKRLLSVLAGLLLGSLLGAGCAESPKEAPAPLPPAAAQKPKSAVTGTAEAAKVEEKPAEVYTYNPAGRRDPFAPIITKREDKAGQLGTRPPLERYPITEFKLAGIVWGGFGYNAMLEGPDGKGYFVRVGTVIGPNRGVVKKITQNTMVIEEKYKTYTGETAHKEIVVELRKKQEGTP